MEDRITPGLYLEMTDRSAQEYARSRVPEVLSLPDVERATWWENCVPGREDLPRRLPEFHLLGVHEVGDRFHAPPRPEDIRGYHFRRYPRPGQGTLSGKPTLGLEFVLISPRTAEEAQALRDWGDFTHIHDIAAAVPPGFTMITPYENVTGGEPRYLHFYEIDTEDAEAAFQGMTPAVLQRMGAPGTHPFDVWAMHPALVIDYVNTFRRLGVQTRAELTASK